ncbi:MAG: hypothetical protein Q4F21_08410 [Lachnospiraceae bacterium]|nr:hypothetical protein [Lachnospiraceae bacterium]
MENTYNYEAVILGENLASLFAGYVLKKHKIRFLIADASEPEAIRKLLAEKKSYEVSEESRKAVSNVYRKLLAQVGISEKTFSGAGEGAERLKTLLLSELEEEISEKKQSVVICEENPELLRCGNMVLNPEVVICPDDIAICSEAILAAGAWGQAISEEKQLRLENYRKRLRIKAGKQTTRKLVYVTHSKSWFYAREAVMEFAVKQGAAAVNPFMNYGFYLNGAVKKDVVTECCHQLIRTVEELWVFGPVSEAILTDIAVAVMEGKEIHFFSISENPAEIHELRMEDITFEREVHAGQIHKSDLLNFVHCTAPKNNQYVQMSLFD